VTSVERNTSTSVTSNDSGNYNQSHLIIGHYSVRVEAQGFNVEVQQGVELAIDTVSTVDFRLKPGKVEETVQVTGEAPLLKTERTDVATTLSAAQVQDLPTFGRNFTELLLQTPGAVQFNWNDTSTENPQGGIAVNVNGQMFVGVGGQVDGTDNRDMMYGNMIIVPNLDSVVEAKITSSNYDAEFGSASAAVVTTSTKSGTNSFHGTAFLYRRNDLFQARDPFTESTPDPVTGKLLPASLWDQFGGSIGGPIKKNKLFFFGDYQGTRAKDGGSATSVVPTAAERTGDFSAWLQGSSPQIIYNPYDANGNIIDPSLRQPFPGNIIPAQYLSAPAMNLLKYIPLPNIKNVAPGINNYAGGGHDVFHGDATNIRIDYFESAKLTFFERYTFTQFLKSAPGLFGALAGGPQLNQIGYTGSGSTRPQSNAMGFNYSLKPSILTDARFGWYRQRIFVSPLVDGDFATEAGAPGLNIPTDPTTLNMPNFNLNGQGGFQFGSSLYNNCNCPLTEKMQQYQFINNWTFVKGNHTIKVGGDIRRLQNLRVPSDQHRAGQVTFTGDITLGPTSGGLPVASYLLGDGNSFSRYVSSSLHAGERQTRIFTYAQDTWRLSPKLTVNFGLRWEIYNPQTVTSARDGGWLQLDTGEIKVAGVNGVPLNGGVRNSYTNLAPRLGFAYQLNPKTVVRAGYGRTFDVGTFGSIFGHSVTQNLPVLGVQSLNPSNSWQSVFNLAVGPPALDPATVLDSQPTGPDGNHLYPNGVRAWVYPQKMRLPTVDAWNATVQHQLTRSISVEAGYVGNKGTHVTIDGSPYDDENAPTIVGFANGLSTDARRPYFSKFGWNSPLYYFGNDTDNHYNSLQTKVEKRFDGNFQLLANYTYSHAKSHDQPYFDIDRNLWYGRPDWQRNNVLVVSNIWELPFGTGKRFLGNTGRALDYAVGGWRISSNTVWMSPQGFNTSYAECSSDNDVGSCHPDRVGSTSVSHRTRNNWYAIAQPLINNGQTSGPWRRPQIGTFGDDVRNSLTGPLWKQTDASAIKSFAVIPEKLNAQFRVDVFNLFNHVNLGNPGGCVDCSNAGVIQSQAPNGAMRDLEFGVRLEF
jgi:outer membrane receptor protein involved in Fe transport